MKTKHNLWVFSFLIVSCFIGCDTDTNNPNVINNQVLSPQEVFQAQFNLDNFNDPSGHIVESIVVDWQNFNTKIIEGKEWYEFKVNQLKPITYPIAGEIQGQFFTLLAHNTQEGPIFYLNKMLSFSAGEGFSYFSIKERYYHGMVYLFNLEGDAEHLLHFQKGKAMHSVEHIKSKDNHQEPLGLVARGGDCHQKANTARCHDALSCGINVGSGGSSNGGSCGNGGVGWVPVTTYHYTDWYNKHGNGQYTYNGTTYDGHTTEYIYVPGSNYNNAIKSYSYAQTTTAGPNLDGYRSGGTQYLPKPPKVTGSQTFKFIIDKSLKNNECAKSIVKTLIGGDYTKLRLNNLGELEKGNHLSSLILNLFKDNKNWNLTIKVAEAGYKRNASTICKGKNCVITIDDDYIKRGTTLAIARTITHESIHAYLEYLIGTDRPSEMSMLLSKYYRDYGNNTGMAQHEMMTQFVDAMAYSLGVWDNFSKPKDFYKYLAWSGDMQKTKTFNSLSEEIKKKIIDANHAEGSAIHKSTSRAKGFRCSY